jgi:hypothetical protein
MKKMLRLTALFLGMMISQLLNAQEITWVKQIITGNSGKFEFAPPYEDVVTLRSYDPVSQALSEPHSIFTQSVQDILMCGPVAFVAAQDSIVKFDADTWERLGTVASSGLSRLALVDGFLVVSKQFPVSSGFVEVRDTAALSLVKTIEGISGDCGGILALGDSIYVAVNGGWAGTEGHLAVIDPSSWDLVREFSLGPEAIGIFNLYPWNGAVISVNKTPYGFPDTGSISQYLPSAGTFTNHSIGVKVGYGYGISGGVVYAGFNDGIGTFDLQSMLIADTTVVADPGSQQFVYITSAVTDTINKRLYVNIGDYVSPGFCLVTSLEGDSITSYPTGISTDAAAVGYRISPAGVFPSPVIREEISIYPNPVSGPVTIRNMGTATLNWIEVTDAFGKMVFQQPVSIQGSSSATLRLGDLSAGIYFMTLESDGSRVVRKVIVR